MEDRPVLISGAAGGRSLVFNQPRSLTDLPDEMLLYMCSYLYLEELICLGCVSRTLRSVSRDSSLSASFRRNVNLCVVGNAGAGKSTMVGHLFDLLGFLPSAFVEDTFTIAKAHALEEMKYAFLCSAHKDQRTHRGSVRPAYMHAKSIRLPFSYTFLDCPGNRAFMPSIMRSIVQSDMMIWVVDKMTGVDNYTRGSFFYEAPLLCYGYGMKRLLVVINKVDTNEFSTAAYDELKLNIEEVMRKRGVKLNVAYIPVSAWTGWNLYSQGLPEGATAFKDDLRLTYKGPTLWEAIQQGAKGTPRRKIKQPFKMTITSMWNESASPSKLVKLTAGTPKRHKRAVLLGTVLQGVIRPGQRIVLTPRCPSLPKEIEISQISIAKDQRLIAPCGYVVGLTTPPGVALPSTSIHAPGTGYMAKNLKDLDLQMATSLFIAEILLLSHTGSPAAPHFSRLQQNAQPVFHFVSGSFGGKIVYLNTILKSTKQAVGLAAPTPQWINGGETAVVSVIPWQPRTIERFNDDRLLGRFAITDNNNLIGLGKVIHVVRPGPAEKLLPAPVWEKNFLCLAKPTSKIDPKHRALLFNTQGSSMLSCSGYPCRDVGNCFFLVHKKNETAKEEYFCVACFYVKAQQDPTFCQRSHLYVPFKREHVAKVLS